MKLNQLIVIALLMTLSQEGFTQTNNRDEYFVTSTDTVFCTDLNWGIMNNSRISDLEYTDMKGEKVVIKGKKNMPEILTLYKNGKITDKIQLEPDRPQGPFRYIYRVVNGKIKAYYDSPTLYTDGSMGGGGSKNYFKMPDGVVYELSKKNMTTILKPFLLSCKEFENKYKGEYSRKVYLFWPMITLYNTSCK